MTTIEPPSSWLLAAGRPAVVVAIANWNRVTLLRECLDSVRAATSYPHYGVCVFDQASTDGSVEYLRGLIAGVDVVFSPRNIGFASAMNAIADRYPAWDMVLLNNDTRVTAGWLTALVDAATRSNAIGLVGPKLVSATGVLQEAGGEVFGDGRVRARGRSASASDPRYQEPRPVDYCSAACLLVKRAVIERCGLLDRAYDAGYYEDVDLAFRAKAAGFDTLYQPRAVVIHREHSSYGADAAGTLMRRHRQIFRMRWATELARRPPSPFELAEAAGRPPLLLVAHDLPGNTLSPRMRRIRQVIRRLNRTFRIAYLNAGGRGFERYDALIEEIGATPFYAPLHGAPGVSGLDEEELVRVNYFPVAICGNADAWRYLHLRFAGPILDATTVAVDLGMEADVVDAATGSAASHFVVMTEAQRSQVTAARPDASCALLPVLPEATTSRRLPREARTDIVMLVDNLDGRAAATAVAGLMRSMVPALGCSLPGAPIRLGGGPGSIELLVERPAGLEMLSSSTAVGAVLDRARVVAIPQHWCGPDTLSNVAEARARAIPIVAPAAVLTAAGLIDGETGVSAETAHQFADAIARIYTDPWYWESLAHPGAPFDDDMAQSVSLWGSGVALEQSVSIDRSTD